MRYNRIYDVVYDLLGDDFNATEAALIMLQMTDQEKALLQYYLQMIPTDGVNAALASIPYVAEDETTYSTNMIMI